MSNRIRRLLGAAVTVSVALVGWQVLGTGQASAAVAGLTGTATCQGDGTYTVVWEFTNDQPVAASVTVSSFGPAGASVAPRQTTAPADAAAQITETGIPGSGTTATLALDVIRAGYPGGAAASLPLAPGCRAGHVATAPSASDGACNPYTQGPIPPSVTIPSDVGVTYTLDGAAEGAGRYPVAPGVHTVVAASTEYTLTGQTRWTFALTAAPSDCTPIAVPVAPTVTQSACVSGSSQPSAPTLRLATTPGVTYTAAPTGPYRAGELVTVTAVAQPGYLFRGAGSGGWAVVDEHHETYTLVFATAPDCRSTVRPVDPTVIQSTCGYDGMPSAPTLTVAVTPDVRYEVSPAGPYRGGQTVSVAATAAAGSRFGTSLPSGWHLTSSTSAVRLITFVPAPGCARPAAPRFSDSACESGVPTAATVTIPATPGIDYTLNGSPALPGNHAVAPSTTAVVTAVAEPGYQLVGVTSWSHTFPAAPTCTQTVVPTPPAFAVAYCNGPTLVGPTVMIPDTPGVEYRIDGAPEASGSYPARPGATVTVTASGRSGYVLAGVTNWSHTFPTSSPTCIAHLVAAMPVFRDASCASPDSAQYTIPVVAGVLYTVGGAVRAAGSYAAAPGSTVTVAVQGRAGYTVAGVTQWQHHFVALPVCGAAPTPPQAIGGAGTPAVTGPPSGPLLLGGLLLLMLGLVCSIAGRRRPELLGSAAASGWSAAGRGRPTDGSGVVAERASPGSFLPVGRPWWRRLRPPTSPDPRRRAWRLDRPG